MRVAAVLLLLSALAQNSTAQCFGLLEASSGPPPHKAIGDASKFASEYVSQMPLYKANGTKPKVLTLDTQQKSDVAVNGARQLFEQEKCVVVVTDRWIGSMLNSTNLIAPAGTKNPFSNVPAAFKQMSLQKPDRAAYVTVGWIPINSPNIDVRKEQDTYVITIKDGHRGWAQYILGFSTNASHLIGISAIDISMDWVASAEASRIFGTWFYIVPDNSKLGRRVRIDLVKTDGTVIASTPCNPKECYPTPAVGRVDFQGADGRTYTVCGPSSACPQFMPRPEYRMLQK